MLISVAGIWVGSQAYAEETMPCRVVKSFARIHAQNLINFGVLPLTFVDPAEYIGIQAGDVLRLVGIRHALAEEQELLVENVTRQRSFLVTHALSPRQIEFALSGGLINWMKERLSGSPVPVTHDRQCADAR